MIETRLAKNREVGQLKELWKICFGDEEDYINLYFDHKYKEEETAVLLWAGKIVAMGTMIPAHMVMENGEKYDLSMLYAIATHPEFQGKGLSAQIMEFCHRYLKCHNKDLSILVPAQESLFNFYGKRGYKDGFYIREVTLTRDQMIELGDDQEEKAFISPITAADYNKMRRSRLEGQLYIDYGNEQIAYQKKLCQKFGGDLYGLYIGDACGCTVVERMSLDEVLIKELLIPDCLLKESIRQIARELPAKQYHIRLPVFSKGDIGGTTRHFGMAKSYMEKGIFLSGESGYLGIAYD